MFSYKTYGALFILGGILSLALTPLVIRLANKLGIVDKPGTRKIHVRPVPLLGGLAVAFGMWVPLAGLFFYDNNITAVVHANARLIWQILLSGLAMLLVGILDDVRGLNARKKFLLQFPIALVLVVSGLHFDSITLPGIGTFNLDFFGPILTILWIVGVTNAINLVDGMDGLATGVAFFAALANALIAIYFGNVIAAVVMVSLAGACFGFLPFNFNPARVFLGDTGSLFLGMTLAVSSLLTAQKGVTATSMLIPILVLGFPIMDTLLSMARRAIRGKSMFSGDAGHIHHRLLAHGLTHRQAAMVAYVVCSLFAMVALVTVMQHSLGIAIGFAGIFLVLFIGLRSLGYFQTIVSLINNPERLKFKAAYHYAEMTKCKLEMAESKPQIADILRTLCQEFGKEGIAVSMPNGTPDKPVCYQWFKNGSYHLGNKPSTWGSEVHEFADTGVKVEFFFLPKGQGDELHLEKRNLLGSIAEVANQNIARLSDPTPLGKPAPGFFQRLFMMFC